MAKKSRNELVFLEDIMECIDKITEYISDVSEYDFDQNVEKQDAVIRRIEIIGEAVNKVSAETLAKSNLVIPWRDIVDFRNLVTHEYFRVLVIGGEVRRALGVDGPRRAIVSYLLSDV